MNVFNYFMKILPKKRLATSKIDFKNAEFVNLIQKGKELLSIESSPLIGRRVIITVLAFKIAFICYFNKYCLQWPVKILFPKPYWCWMWFAFKINDTIIL